MFNSFALNSSFRVKELALDKNGSLESREVSYSALLDDALLAVYAIEKNLPSKYQNGKCIIGIVAHKSSFMISLIIGTTLKTGNAFALFEPAPAAYLEKQFKRFRIEYALCDSHVFDADAFSAFEYAEAGRIRIAHFMGCETIENFSMEGILYAIQTSGSTGTPKVILVPYTSILPNIEDFIERFSIDQSSTLLYSTSVNFDPSIVELFIALKSGSELLIPPSDWIESSISRIILCQVRLSFLQLTPAVLQCLPSDVLAQILGPNSLISSLLIGGDIFPVNLLKKYYTEQSRVSVFNVYGITEVSCWASVHPFHMNDLDKYPSGLMPIGSPLLNTRLEVSKDGILLIHGRKCIVDFQISPGPTSTDDFAVTMHHSDFGGKEIIFVRGRHKPNSILPDFEAENEVMSAFPDIVFSKLIYVRNCRFLFVDHVDGSSVITDKRIRSALPKKHWPTRIFWNVAKFSRLSPNGKIDKNFLRRYICSEYKKEVEFHTFIQQRYNIPIDAQTLQMSFHELGIGSIEAAEICFLLNRSNSSIDPVTTMSAVLDGRNTLGDFLKRFSLKLIPYHAIFAEKKAVEHIVVSKPNFEIRELWSENLGKCIDGTPVYDNGIVYAASHSGILKGIHFRSGNIVFFHSFENERFEAGCTVVGSKYIAIGGFSGRLYVFDKALNGHAFYAKIECQSEIRMTPVSDANMNLFWGSYDGWIWKMNIPTKQITQFDASEYGRLRTDPLFFDSLIVYVTLGAYIFAVDKDLQNIVWSQRMDSPIFAAPISFERKLFVLTVKGSLHAIGPHNGNSVSSISLSGYGHFFDSPTIIDQNGNMLLSAGASLILCSFNPSEDSFRVLRHFKMPEMGSFLRRPIIFGDFIFLLSNKGFLLRSFLDNFSSSKVTPCKFELIFSGGVETFGHPLLLPAVVFQNSKELCGADEVKHLHAFIVVFGARDDLLRSKIALSNHEVSS